MAVTFSELKTRIIKEAGDNTTSGQAAYFELIGNAIVSAIKFYESSKLWFLEERDTLTLTSGLDYTALPDDFRAAIELRVKVNGSWRGYNQGFSAISYQELIDQNINTTNTGCPSKYAFFADSIYFDRVADQNYDIDISYIKGDVTYPESDSDISVWFDEGEDLIRYKALEMFYRDSRDAEEKAAYYKQAASDTYINLVERHMVRQTRRRVA